MDLEVTSRLVLNIIRISVVLVLFIFVGKVAIGAEPSMPNEARQAMEKGLAAAKSQDYKLAIQYFKEARKTAPYSPELLFNLGLAESKIPGRELLAMVWFKAFLAVSPNAPEAQKVRNQYGQLEATVKRTIKDLIALYKEVLVQLPQHGYKDQKDKGFLQLAYLQGFVGDIESAKQSAETLSRDKTTGGIGAVPGKSDAYFWIVWLEAERGNVESALKIAALAGPKRSGAYGVIAYFAAEKGNFEAVLEAAHKAGDTKNAHYCYISEFQAKRGDIKGALKSRQLSLTYGNECRYYVTIIHAMVKAGDFKAALEMLSSALEGIKKDKALQSYKKDYMGLIAWVLAKKGDINGALKTLEQIHTEDFDIYHAYVAEAQAESGDIKGALKTASLDKFPHGTYERIAYIQVLNGDIAGANKTADLIPDDGFPNSFRRRRILAQIKIASYQIETRSATNLRERIEYFYILEKINETLDSPDCPWFTDVRGFLKAPDSYTFESIGRLQKMLIHSDGIPAVLHYINDARKTAMERSQKDLWEPIEDLFSPMGSWYGSGLPLIL